MSIRSIAFGDEGAGPESSPSSLLKKTPGEGTGPTEHVGSRGIPVGRVPPRGALEVFQQAARVKLSASAAELLGERRNGVPIWVRAPKRGVEFYSGLSRAKLYDLVGRGKIRSSSLREPGQIKGTRLFHLGSILEYIESNEISPSEPSQGEETEE